MRGRVKVAKANCCHGDDDHPHAASEVVELSSIIPLSSLKVPESIKPTFIKSEEKELPLELWSLCQSREEELVVSRILL